MNFVMQLSDNTKGHMTGSGFGTIVYSLMIKQWQLKEKIL